MLPKIVISKDKAKLDTYISSVISEHRISPHAVFHIVPLKKELGIDQIRTLKKGLIVAQSQKQLYILRSFQTATTEAQNALLKTLEEKNEDNLFLLLTSSIGHILPTILSRSQIVVLDQELSTSEYTFMNQLTKEQSYSFLAHPELQTLDAQKAVTILEYLLSYVKENYRNHRFYAAVMKKILFGFQALNNNNANPQLLIDNLLIVLHKRIALDQNV